MMHICIQRATASNRIKCLTLNVITLALISPFFLLLCAIKKLLPFPILSVKMPLYERIRMIEAVMCISLNHYLDGSVQL